MNRTVSALQPTEDVFNSAAASVMDELTEED